ncbi:hypothetical protein [Alkalihalobacterium alkalinitrilicum]|uniref:hypothetical protein n=1 Tax=Alkalihalobacterium alkalinitrilicum TaxID=427920 RepID=UPI000994B109|nr:hypothetical protein [Alkalihalobacterium alkalinitrilicum]
MEHKVMEKIRTLRKRLNDDPEQVSYDLYSLEKYVAESLLERNFAIPNKVKSSLERQFANQKPEDMRSYNIGKAHTLIELISIMKKPYDLDQKVKELNDLDKKILKYIAHHREVTPTAIRNEISELNDNKQYTSNVLSKLRQIDMIAAHQVGKYRWYFLTILGEEIVNKIEKVEEFEQKLNQIKSMLAQKKEKLSKPVRKQPISRERALSHKGFIAQHMSVEETLQEVASLLSYSKANKEKWPSAGKVNNQHKMDYEAGHYTALGKEGEGSRDFEEILQ